jgi:hypothetical protein
VKLVSCVLNGPALNYGMSHIDGKDQFIEFGAVFQQLESQFDTLHINDRLSPLSVR